MSIAAAFIIALLISMIFLSPTGYRRDRIAVVPVILFFTVLFMAGIAAQYWITPFGPIIWGVSWLPVLFMVLLFSILLSSPPVRYHRRELAAGEPATGSAEPISPLVWAMLVLLLTAIIIGVSRKAAF